jgi:phosphatidylinositol alpha-1,6-mannosyltransferase
MPKRLIITLEYPPQIGGIATYVVNLARQLPAEETVVYAPKLPATISYDDRKPWKTIREEPFWLLWPHWLKMLFQVWRIVKSENITELYIQQVLPVGYVGLLLKKFKKIPYTLFLHGTDIEFAGRWNKRRQFKKICQEAQRIIVNSEFLKTKLQGRVEQTPPVVVLHPGAPDYFFEAMPAQELQILKSALGVTGKKVLLTVARAVEGKGITHLVRLLPKLLEAVPDVVWVLIGEGPKLASVSQYVQQNHLQNCVRILGTLPHAQLPYYYQIADAFALLTHPDSEAEEGWGIVFIEAAASGVPVVAGSVGGVEEAVINNTTGFVVDVYKPEEALAAITKLLTEPELAKTFGQAGRMRANEEFRWEKQVKNLL